MVTVLTAWAGHAHADPPLRAGADLDGVYLALGPVGSAVRTEGSWQGAFGGEITLVRVAESSLVAGLGMSLGGTRFSDRDAGRLWIDGLIATRRPLDLTVGLSVGATAEVDEVIPPRYGAHGTLWLFVGVIPYVRAGIVERAGGFVELGVKLAIPTVRF